MIDSLDGLRGRALSLFGARAPRLLRDRELRVAVYGLGAIGVALAITFGAPLVLLASGPLVLGVPHIIADVRYLVARPALHRRAELWLAIGLPAGASWFFPHAWVAMLGPAFAAAFARAPVIRRGGAAAAAAVAVVVSIEHERLADLVLAHAHNAVAVGLFAVWSRRRTNLHWVVVLAFVASVVAIGLGAFDGAPFARLASGRLLDVDRLFESIAPFGDPRLAARAVLVFAFAQSVHYAVWIRLVPEEDRPRPGLRSFRSSLAALREDLGLPLLAIGAVAAAAIGVWGCVGLGVARDGYLRLAVFHGPLELGAATLLLLERGTVRLGGPP